jgi:acyl-coenzyme A thioesterase PaaI-like protein
MTNTIPEGYKPLKRSGGFLTSVGPWYYRRDEKNQMALAIRIEDRHCNIRHIAHGGFLVCHARHRAGHRRSPTHASRRNPSSR